MHAQEGDSIHPMGFAVFDDVLVRSRINSHETLVLSNEDDSLEILPEIKRGFECRKALLRTKISPRTEEMQGLTDIDQ